jgi:hypothetical protein
MARLREDGLEMFDLVLPAAKKSLCNIVLEAAECTEIICLVGCFIHNMRLGTKKKN